MNKVSAIIAATSLFAMATPASAVVINATGEGWCNSGGSCNNTNTAAIRNTFAGVISPGGVTYRDWFYFNIPVGTYVSAILSINNDGLNVTSQASSVFTLSAATGVNYSGLGSGTALGSVTVGAADTGTTHYVNITLNGSALTLLNTAAGGGFLFGGSVNGNNASVNQIFGYGNGNPVAFLTLVPQVPIPEPEAWLMMMLGFAAIGKAMRRKQPKVRLKITYA